MAGPIFLFDPSERRSPNTARKVHIRRLYDVLELSLHRGDIQRARRAWVILVRCKELDWKSMWRTGTLVAGECSPLEGVPAQKRLEYLSTMMRQHSEARETIFQEYILLLIQSGQSEKALDELELYLPSPPYQDNSMLHLYAGLICLHLVHAPDGTTGPTVRGTLREAEQYFERAVQLDAGNVVAATWLGQIPILITHSNRSHIDGPSSDGEREDRSEDETRLRNKRVKT
ncbi:hypothetical protein BDW22DRAFT_1404566 [Trametopsis cervina]|nr:hypothetical protein BDW22DRAFT_1404566 [Trametopsis cervina]